MFSLIKILFRPDNCFLYGVFDGHNGTRVADFAALRFPAELLLGQLQPNFSDNEVKEALKQVITILSIQIQSPT